MSNLETVEVDGSLVGILTRDHGDRSFHFHSGVSPYDLLNGSRFSRSAEAREAVRRMKLAASQIEASAYRNRGLDR